MNLIEDRSSHIIQSLKNQFNNYTREMVSHTVTDKRHESETENLEFIGFLLISSSQFLVLNFIWKNDSVY